MMPLKLLTGVSVNKPTKLFKVRNLTRDYDAFSVKERWSKSEEIYHSL